MRRRHKLTTLLTMPLAVFLWVVGWSLFWIGSRKKRVEPRRKPARDELRFAVLVPEQEYAKQQTLAG